jgi:hypothetical protein
MAGTTGRATGTRTVKAAKAANPARMTKAAPRPVPAADDPDMPPELRDMYGPPKLSRARGTGTTGSEPEVSFDFDTSAPAAEVPMERLFSIDGVPYFIPVEFPPSYAIVFLDALDEGRDIAVGRVLKLATGEGWKALVDLAARRPDLIPMAQFSALMEKVMLKVMGAVEAVEGNG